MALFNGELPSLKEVLSSCSITDEETKAVIKKVFENNNYVLDPHGAVGFLALQRYLAANKNGKGYFLETAHPVKFYDAIEPVIGQKIVIPESIADLLKQEKKSIKLKPDDEALKALLMAGSLQALH
jgi:threonine synthase